VHPTRAEDDIGIREGFQQTAKLFGLVRSVGVHLDKDVIALVERRREPGEVGRAQPFLALSMKDPDVVILGRQLIRDGAGAVRGAVVQNKDVGLGHSLAQPRHDQWEVLAFVVGRDQHDDRANRGPDLRVCHKRPL